MLLPALLASGFPRCVPCTILSHRISTTVNGKKQFLYRLPPYGSVATASYDGRSNIRMKGGEKDGAVHYRSVSAECYRGSDVPRVFFKWRVANATPVGLQKKEIRQRCAYIKTRADMGSPQRLSSRPSRSICPAS